MTSPNPLTDPRVSDEVRAMARYLAATGVPHRVTTTIDHPSTTAAGFPSRHVAQGTNGQGLAMDVAGPSVGDVQALIAIWQAFSVEAHALHELIFGVGVPFCVLRGKRVELAQVPSALRGQHLNHVHVSVNKGVLLVPPHPPLSNTTVIQGAFMGLAKSDDDAAAALVRFLFLEHLLREPTSEDEANAWVAWYREHGLDATIYGIVDSPEGQVVLAAKRHAAGL